MILLLLMSILTLALPAQVKVSDHLSNPNITCFEQDSHGRIWIGTSYGLNRYNGNDFHHFLVDAIPGNRIEDILCDSKGRIWIGTDNGVASYTDSKGFTTYEVRSDMKKVNQILEDKDGRIMINLTEDLCMLDTLKNCFVPITEFFDRFYQYHQKAYIGADSLLWVVSASEIRCFNTATLENIDNQPTPIPALVSELFPSGNIIFGGGKDLFRYDTRTSECRKLDCNLKEEISLIDRISETEAVIKTSDGRLTIFNEQDSSLREWNPEFDNRFNLTTVYSDSGNNIWLGSSEDGFKIIRSKPEQFNNDRELVKAFQNHSILSMDVDSHNNVWAITSDGIYVYENRTKRAFKAIPSGISLSHGNDILQNNPPAIMVDSKDRIWLAMPNQRKFYQGRLNADKLLITREYNSYYPHRFKESENGKIWCGLRNESLISIDENEMRALQVFPWNNTETRDIVSLGDNILVAAYNDHLALVNTDDCSISHLSIRSGSEKTVSRDGVFDPSVMFKDSSFIWIGTRNSGLLRYSLSNNALARIEGIPSECISSIEGARDGGLWIGTPDGLFHRDGKTGYVKPFLANDGIGGTCFTEGASCTMSDGTVLFGGTHGITQINPEWQAGEQAGLFTFEDLNIGNDHLIDISAISGITLTHKDNSFSISFVNIVMDSDSRQDYSYMLDGYDKDWIDSGNRRIAYYSNLNPGKYCFRVMANGEEHQFNIRIKPHFLLTWWMELLYIILFSATLVWILRNRRIILESRQIATINEMNMRFFTNISHEFRTPLTMISGPAEQLAQDESLSRDQKGLVNIMQSSISRMLTLVNQLLELGKIENDTLRLQVTNTDIIPLVRLICEPFRHSYEKTGGTFNLVFESGTLNAMVDEDKLQKILSNLLSNAVKYTPTDGVITVNVTSDHSNATISVSDNGPGVPPEKIEKIFERFYHLGKDSKEKNSYSTGIGLYYARALAKVHHGSLVARNRAEGGMIFTYKFPVNVGSYSEEEIKIGSTIASGPVETVPALVDTSLAVDDNRPYVLIIDDDKDLLAYISSLLSKYRVMAFGNAEDALEIARKDAPDVILSDVMMPGMSGLELCRAIKEDMILSHIPVILVTAKGAVDSQVEGLEQGADAYVTKPFSPSYLLALVKAQIDKHQKIRQLINSSDGNENFDTSGLPSKDAAFLREIYSRMDSILDQEGIDIAEIAEQMGVSRSKFYYKIKALTGKTPSDFLMQYRLNVAAKMLKEGKKNVSEVAYSVGFSTLPHFSKCFKKQFGVSPSKYV